MGMPFPEAELRNGFTIKPDGSIGAFRTSQAIHDAIGEGARKRVYDRIRVPVLAFFPVECAADRQTGEVCIEGPRARGAYEPKTDDERAAIRAFDEATQAYVNRWKANLRTAVPLRSLRTPRTP